MRVCIHSATISVAQPSMVCAAKASLIIDSNLTVLELQYGTLIIGPAPANTLIVHLGADPEQYVLHISIMRYVCT
jgi:hypothetical protein